MSDTDTTIYDDGEDEGVQAADVAAFLASEPSDKDNHVDIVLNGHRARFWFRDCSRTEAIHLAKLAEDGQNLQFDRELLATLTVEPTRLTAADVKRWQARRGSQAQLGPLVDAIMKNSGFTAEIEGGDETERFSE